MAKKKRNQSDSGSASETNLSRVTDACPTLNMKRQCGQKKIEMPADLSVKNGTPETSFLQYGHIGMLDFTDSPLFMARIDYSRAKYGMVNFDTSRVFIANFTAKK